MSKRVAIDALTAELRAIDKEIEEANHEKAVIARALSTLTGRDDGGGRVSVKTESYAKRPSAASIPGQILGAMEASGAALTMKEIGALYYGHPVDTGGAEYRKICIYPGPLVNKGFLKKLGDGRYQATTPVPSTNGSAPAPAAVQEEVKVPF